MAIGITTPMAMTAGRPSPSFEPLYGVRVDVGDADVFIIAAAEEFDLAEVVTLAKDDVVIIDGTLELDFGGIVLIGCVPVSELPEVRLPLMNTTRTAA